ncbi:putative mitochondrial peptidyl-dipeptidase [Leptomonas pyrrhocoris]|uniref:oligopeptidase A n=1 Tax=Leptomonas pyrrhocoris TaxID=157538 RepID=A0A0N0DT18_LEPPY|nr:putative mitochondrial peptidyl-dipeptidase [Leptomonas pyrrhocoris]KPA76862.1 putative mitochondrial peptidyl-dipeptidase [Leptomonas pyrrhocoris]|eukprot:XP_015655301.1 putative mitochondrial peptidyl-dipeptidase [Leptomonas pyrrhocoris]
MQKLEQEYAPQCAAHRDAIFLDRSLYERLRAVSTKREQLEEAEDRRLVEVLAQKFTIAGAALSEEKKTALRDINARLATLETIFGRKLLGTNLAGSLIVDTEAELDGLSAEQLMVARRFAASLGRCDEFALKLLNTTQQPLFASLKTRETRRRLYEASVNRASRKDDNDTRSTIEEILLLRLRKAHLLGKACFADWKLQDQMAERETAEKLLLDLTPPAMAAVERDAHEIQELIKARGNDFVVEPWDWAFYAEQVRKRKHDLDEAELMPHFELQTVLEKGVFFAANQLYGITMVRRTDLPVYDPDTLCYEAFDADDTSLALFYLDPYERPNKKGGAWMTCYVLQSKLLQQRPVVFNVLNVPKPDPGKPTLLSQRNIITLFHEFGHGLHGMLSDKKFASLACTNVPRDYVELPSQVNEKWAHYGDVLKHYAIHYETKEPIPQSLIHKMQAAEKFGGGFQTLENIKASAVDLYLHSITDEKDFRPIPEMERAAMEHFQMGMPAVPPRYFTPYFAHTFQWGYSAGFYAYTWAKLLDCDAFEWFREHGGLARANGDHFRKCVLSVGNTIDLNQAYFNFAGRKPGVGPLLRSRGL